MLGYCPSTSKDLAMDVDVLELSRVLLNGRFRRQSFHATCTEEAVYSMDTV